MCGKMCYEVRAMDCVMQKSINKCINVCMIKAINKCIYFSLTHCSLLMPYGEVDLGQTLAQVMAFCLMAPSHYLNHVDLSSVRSSDIHLKAISQEIPKPPITKFNLKITCLKFYSSIPGTNELIDAKSCRLSLMWYFKFTKSANTQRWNSMKNHEVWL